MATHWTALDAYRCDRLAPRRAREFCAWQLSLVLGIDAIARAAIERAQAIASELIAEAVESGADHAGISLAIDDGQLRISVGHDGAGPAAILGLRAAVLGGMADTWQIEPIGPGARVWAQFALGQAGVPDQRTVGSAAVFGRTVWTRPSFTRTQYKGGYADSTT